MTTTSPGTLVPATALPTWRIAWADRENDRRRRVHHAELETWRHRVDELTRQRIEAATFLGCTEPRTGLPVQLDPYELVFRIIPAAELIEVVARHAPGLPLPALSVGPHDASSRTLPKGLRVADTGVAVITSRRVAFAGREVRREWWYADLIAPAHHPDAPLTLLHPSRPGRLSGLRVPAAVVANTRFYLALALASATGRRNDVIAELDALLLTQHRDRPMPPVPVEPWQAPLTARRPDRRVAAVAAVAAAAFATLTAGAYGSEERVPLYRAEADGRSAVELPMGIGAVIPTLTPAPGAPGSAVAPTGAPAPGGTSGGGAEPATGSRETAAGSTGRPTTGGNGGGSRPGVVPVAPAAPTSPAPAAPPSTAPPSSAAPSPSKPPSSSPPPPATPEPEPTAAPADEDDRLLTVCLDPLRLPLLDPLLCPRDDD
ncbi:hypothetical protein ABZ814_30280 [Micromonospora musae]|uniref:hypothetical protein n=1 Tax=Micromonospora musae TaxID=1894970 RepID=UPI0033EC8CB3